MKYDMLARPLLCSWHKSNKRLDQVPVSVFVLRVYQSLLNLGSFENADASSNEIKSLWYTPCYLLTHADWFTIPVYLVSILDLSQVVPSSAPWRTQTHWHINMLWAATGLFTPLLARTLFSPLPSFPIRSFLITCYVIVSTQVSSFSGSMVIPVAIRVCHERLH